MFVHVFVYICAGPGSGGHCARIAKGLKKNFKHFRGEGLISCRIDLYVCHEDIVYVMGRVNVCVVFFLYWFWRENREFILKKKRAGKKKRIGIRHQSPVALSLCAGRWFACTVSSLVSACT